jgi:glycosyltransferase involved in cell wall biosynthesis
MNIEQTVYLIVFLLWCSATLQGIVAFAAGIRFLRYVRKAVERTGELIGPNGGLLYQPRVAIILPCCGVDEKLAQTVGALADLDYDDYEIIFAFESEQDPAYEPIGRWTADWQGPKPRRVVAGLAEERGQKIHNLLAAVEEVSADREVLVFLDSDVVPHRAWLGHLVAPLRDEAVGAATGYRWYAATGGLAAGVRCAWNAATVSLLDDEKRNFCWGGSTAMRYRDFEVFNVARYWSHALSDDLQLTRAIRDAGRLIHFVPQAMVSSPDSTTFMDFWRFARRQVIITRICGREVWRSGFVLCANMIAGGVAVAMLFAAGLFGWFGSRASMYTALGGWAVITILAGGKALLRQKALRLVLKPPELTWRDAWWDVFGTLFLAGPVHLNLIFSTLRTRRIVWRQTEYELVSASETRVLGRIAASGRQGCRFDA